MRGAMRFLPILFGVLLLAACGTARPSPTPTPTRTPRPFGTPAAATPISSPVPTPTPDLTHCPLTGARLEDQSVALRRPLIVKIGNDTKSRPQTGIHKADIVVEHLTEGGITRLDAVYLCQEADKIGPVRSARLIDIPLAYLFDGISAHAGASNGVIWVLRNEASFPRLNGLWEPMSESEKKPPDPGFVRDPNGKEPYNMFTSTSALWQVAEARGWQKPMSRPRPLFGSLNPNTSKETTSEVTIPYSADNRVSWRWDQTTQKYLRFVNGNPQSEATTGEQISASNVIIIWAQHTETSIIEDEYTYPKSLQITLNAKDEGGHAIWSKAYVLRDGYLVPARWIWRWIPYMLELADEAGNPLPLAVGNSWIEVVPLTLEIQTK